MNTSLDRKQIEEIQKIYLSCGKYNITCAATGYSLPTVRKYVKMIELDENGELVVPKIPEYSIQELRKKMEESNLNDYSPKVFLLSDSELKELENLKKVL